MHKSTTIEGPDVKWRREGTFIYALMHHAWVKGVEQFRNRFAFSAMFDSSVPERERENLMRLLHKAPEVLHELRKLHRETARHHAVWCHCPQHCEPEARRDRLLAYIDGERAELEE